MTQSWKVSLPCTRTEAEQLKDDVPALALLDSPPVLMTSESDPGQPNAWRMDAYFDHRPGKADLALLRSLVPSASGATLAAKPIANQDWVTLSQAGLEPIRAGRFFIYTPAHRDEVPQGTIALEIDAGRAFGTGHHETTTGCLIALDTLRRRGARYANLLDLGTGTGLLAFAALRLWPTAEAAASDIDPVAVEVARDNAKTNGITIGRARGQVELAIAAGMRHRRLQTRAPYDLILANILAGPLIELALPISAALAPGGTLILAGLLKQQAEGVTAAYRRQGLMPVNSIVLGDWPTLVMRKRRRAERR